jgi:hypothetical protein
MKTFLGTLAATVFIAMLSFGGAAAASLDTYQSEGDGQAVVTPVGGDYCRDLRWSCLHKDELGERGEGNCRRYREECRGYGDDSRDGYSERDSHEYCERLRWECRHKWETGREGEGLCHKYRERCGGDWR